MSGPPSLVAVWLEIGSEEREAVKLGRHITVGARWRLGQSQYSAAKPVAESVPRDSQQCHYSLQNGLLLKNSASVRVSPMSFSIRSSSAASSARSRVRRRHSPKVSTTWLAASFNATIALLRRGRAGVPCQWVAAM